MTLHMGQQEVGVRQLHDRLSEYLERVEAGAEVVVTKRGRRVARLSRIEAEDPLAELVGRGLVRMPEKPRARRKPRVEPAGSVADLVAEQRR